MASSLYNTSKRSRRIVLFLLVGALLIVLYDFANSLSSSIDVATTTNVRRFYMNADRLLGDVPPPQIPSIERDTNNNVTYIVEGVFPDFPDVAYVYAIEEPSEKLLTFQNAQSVVNELGFDDQSFNQNGNVSTWRKDNNVTTVEFDRVEQIWQMSTNFDSNSRFSINQTARVNTNAALGIVNDLNFDSFGYDNGVSSNILLNRQTNGDLVEVDEEFDTQLYYANAFRVIPFADLLPNNEQPDLLPNEAEPEPVVGTVFTDDPLQGSARFIVKGEDLDEDIYEFEFIDFEYNQSPGAYLIITPEEAWSSIQVGQGSLTLLRAQNDERVGAYEALNTRRFVVDAAQTEIGYYEPREWDGFVYPIYVFSGRAELENGRLANFVFYIDAIKRL